MDSISDYLSNAMATNQASALSFVQAFGKATVTEIEAFWSQITSEAEAKAIDVADHEIVKAADSAGVMLPNDPRLTPGLLLPTMPGSSPGTTATELQFTPVKKA